MRLNSLQKQFQNYSELSMANHVSFHEMMRSIFKNGHWNSATFAEATGLDSQFFYRLTTSEREFSRRILVSVCAGLELDTVTSNRLLASMGLALSPARMPDRAYAFLLEYGKGLTVEERNGFLEAAGVDEKDLLGSLKRKNS